MSGRRVQPSEVSLPAPRPPGKETQRIAKLLARAGLASRREVERMIADGRVAIDGKPVETPATLLASLHGVTVDGKPVQAAAPARLFRYHKPAGRLTAERDPKGRPTIYDRLPPGLPRVIPVGRLDLNTEGLLLLTTDGGLKRQLELPASGVERVYRARVFGEVSQDRLEQLIEGIKIEGVRYGAIDANLERRTGRNAWVEMKLKEGKNREVRRVLEHLGLQVSRLIRTAYGPFALGDLPAGGVDEVRQHDLVAFRKWLENPSAAKMDIVISAQPRRAEPAPARKDTKRPAGVAASKAGPRPKPGARSGGPRRPGTAPPGASESRADRKAGNRIQRPPKAPAPAGKRAPRATEAEAAPTDAARPRKRPAFKPGWARPAKPSTRGRPRRPPRS
jgi:23S rRNA pseudouridine2605 synthase